MTEGTTNEIQNQAQYDEYDRLGQSGMGPWTSYSWRHDPRRLVFVLSRYKFCARMVEGKKHVLEVGCGDAFGTPIVQQVVETVKGIDIEPLVVDDASRRFALERPGITVDIQDLVAEPVKGEYDAAYALDVIEHIPAEHEDAFLSNITAGLRHDAVCIMGTPNIEANKYASEQSRVGHINLKSGDSLRSLLEKQFENVFMFSMNDEVVHTGFTPMAHYLFAVGAGLRSR